MTRAEAIELIRDAAPARRGAVWADFGAGSGTFSEALAELLGKTGKVIAIDRDARALRELRRAAAQSNGVIHAVEGDLLELDAIPVLQRTDLDGALFANVLHFFSAPHEILTSVRRFLQPDASIVVIEYDRRQASRWVPYPLSLQQLKDVAQKAGLSAPVKVGRRASRYQGDLYCAVLRLQS